MQGLEKINSRIIADAERDAKAKLDAASAECDRIAKENAEMISGLRRKMNESASREGEAIISRARSAAEMEKKNILLSEKGRLVDQVFNMAYSEIMSQNGDKYEKMLEGLLTAALKERIKGESESLELYGEDVSSVSYEIIFNKNDRARYGEKVVSEICKSLVGIMPEHMKKGLALSEDVANISGGLILRCGDIESNCSIESLFDDIRDEYEGKVYKILFDKRK